MAHAGPLRDSPWHGEDVPGLDGTRLELLAGAIRGHNGAGPAAEATRAVCLDADRLNLWRVGITPDPALLSLDHSRAQATILEGRRMQDEPVSWDLVRSVYALLLPWAATLRVR